VDIKEIQSVLTDNTEYIIRTGYRGWDPYDLQELPFYRNVLKRGSRSIAGDKRNYFFYLVRIILFSSEIFFPKTLRKILRVPVRLNYKALGLIGLGYISQYRKTKDPVLLEEIQKIRSMLLSNSFASYPGKHWGYPFDWQSSVFFPKGTPSGVVTSVIGKFFLEYRACFNDTTVDPILHDIAEFFMKGLNRTGNGENEVCFSYTPMDTYQVHNANLFVAEYLLKVSVLLEDNSCRDLALKAMKFTLNRINEDGSIYYGTGSQYTTVDNYHTGFVIRTLVNINLILQDPLIRTKIDELFNYYFTHFFHLNKYPRITNTSLNPVDIHSVSESILVLDNFRKSSSSIETVFNNVVEFAVNEMYCKKKGYFIYRVYITKGGKSIKKVKIPYLRWSQAWMNFALSSILFPLPDEQKPTFN
jgi:hypothetical protein